MDLERPGAFHIPHGVQGRPQAGTRLTVRVEQPGGILVAFRCLVVELPAPLLTTLRLVVPLSGKTLDVGCDIGDLAGPGRGALAAPLELRR